MGRCLIVANQTLGGPDLDAAIRERIDHGSPAFTVLVPLTAPRHESTSWLSGFTLPEAMTGPQAEDALMVEEELARRRARATREAQQRAEHRLREMLRRIRDLGGQADGEVGVADPVVAVAELLSVRRFDEIIVSTLPHRISRWLKLDVPSQIERFVDVPVHVIEATDE